MEYTFKGYRILCVYQQVDSELAQELVDFWIDNKAIPNLQRARQRVPQVVLIARNTAGQIAGVSTVYSSKLYRKQQYYFLRMFIRPADRLFGLGLLMGKRTRDHLSSLQTIDKPKGMAFVTENIKLMRSGMRREFERIGYKCQGKTRRGFDLWISDF